MFGIFYVIYNGIVSGINGIDKDFQNSKARAKAIDLKDITYYSRGQMYLTENGRQVVKSWDPSTKHEVIKDIRNGKIYYDLSVIKEEKAKQESIAEGRTVYRVTKNNEGLSYYHKNRTGIYCVEKDIETDHLVHEICINKYRFYLDIYTGKILRLSDSCVDEMDYFKRKGLYKRESLNYNDIIYYFNKRQEKLSKHVNYNYSGNDWMREVYYLSNKLQRYEHLFMNQDGKFTYGNDIELTVWSRQGRINVNTGDYI